MISEPMTLLTDYLLAGISGYAGWILFQRSSNQCSQRAWAIAFFALMLGAFAGGSYHGFFESPVLWKITLLIIGFSNFFMLAGSLFSTTSKNVCRSLLILSAAKLFIYSGWILYHDEFLTVILDSAASMGVITVLHGLAIVRDRDLGSKWIIGGVCISIVASIIQASHFAIASGFNHNDLYHVIQIIAVSLFYQGARRLKDSPCSE